MQVAASAESLFHETIAICGERLRQPPLRDLVVALQRHNIDAQHCRTLVAAVTHRPESVAPLLQARDACGAGPGTTFERCVILQAASVTLNDVADAGVPGSVKTRICQEIRMVSHTEPTATAGYQVGTSRFERLCKISTLRRLPAGLFECEVGGIARSDCLRTHPLVLPRVLAFVAFRMGGFAPVYFSHLNPHCIGRPLDELEANKSYYRIAMALKQKPNVLGFGACSWFRAPATHRVSPHLAWLSDVFLKNGGLVVDAGTDNPDSGALYRSRTRRALYDAGKWVPRRGLVMWPREAMLAWAARHRELAD